MTPSSPKEPTALENASDGLQTPEQQHVLQRISGAIRSALESFRTLCQRESKSQVRRRRSESMGVEGLEPRLLMSATPAEVRYVDANGAYVLRTETVTEAKTIDFRTLEQGVHGEQWTTNVPGLGKITAWFQGGTKIDSHGMSAVTQPDWGTGFWIRFDDGPVKVLSAELDFMGTSPRGQLGMQANGDYIRENDRIVYLPLQTSVNMGGRTMSVLDEAQNSGKVAVKSITIAVPVTKEVKDYVDDEDDSEGIIEQLAASRLAQQETVTETVTEVKTIDFRTLEQGVHGEQWTTNVPGLGKITAWFQGGTKIDSHGMSAVTQPDWGTGFWIRFDDGPVKVLSAELDFMGTNPEGRLGMQANGDYIRENDRIVYLPLQTSVNMGGRTMSVLDEAQRYGKVAVKSITVETLVTREVKQMLDDGIDEIIDDLAAGIAESQETVLAPVSATLVRIGNQGALGLRVSTPLDETYLQTTNYGVIRAEHIGGAEDFMIFNNYLTDMMENDRGSATKTWTLYADKDLKIPLAELTFVGNRSGITLLSSVAQPIQKNMLPRGVEYEPAPEMEVAHLEGPNVIFEVSSPIARSVIEFVGVHDDSILGRATVTKGDAGVRQTATITMNPANATGDYNAIMKGADGRVFGRVLLHWDKDCKQLSLPAGSAVWTASEEFAPTLDAAKRSLRENLVDISTTDQSLGAIQREILLSAASSMPGIGVDFDAKFFASHPEWSATLRESMKPSELRTFSDTYGILKHDFGTFQSMLGDFLRQGTSILTQIRSGRNETALRDEFARVVSVAATSLPMYRLASIGITMPAGGIILEAAKGAGEQTIGQLMAVKKAESKVVQRQEAELAMLSSGKYVRDVQTGALVAATQIVVERSEEELEAVHKHNLEIIMTSEGLGDFQVRVRDYAEANKLSSAFVMRMTGVSVTRVADTGGDNTGPAGVSVLHPAATLTGVGNSMNLQKVSEISELRTLSLLPNEPGTIQFELTQDSMVNLWTDATSVGKVKAGTNSYVTPGFSLRLTGGPTNIDFFSHKSTGAESVSAMLAKGTYTLTVQNESGLPAAQTDFYSLQTSSRIVFPVNVQITHRNTANIEGRVSIEGKNEALPVSMRVAEFYTDENNQVKRKTDYNLDPSNGGINKLDPSKPVWVVVHGMNSGEDKAVMNELTKSLVGYKDQGIQVVTIDWSQAAESINTSDAQWTPAVGKWVAHQLLAAGFQPNQINVAGWSHGTFVAYEMGQELQKDNRGQINTLVALDAARNFAGISGYENEPDFRTVSRQAISFDSSLIAGDDGLATKADYSFVVRSLEIDPFVRHRLAVGTFTSILNGQKKGMHAFSEVLTFQKMMQSMEAGRSYAKDRFAGGFEGIIDIGVLRENIGNEIYERAMPSIMHIMRPDIDKEDTLYFTSIDA